MLSLPYLMRPSLHLPTMNEDLSNIHLSKAEFQEYGYRLVDWLAEYFDNVDQYQESSIEPGDIRNMLPVSAPEGPSQWMRLLLILIGSSCLAWLTGSIPVGMLSFLRGHLLYLLG